GRLRAREIGNVVFLQHPLLRLGERRGDGRIGRSRIDLADVVLRQRLAREHEDEEYATHLDDDTRYRLSEPVIAAIFGSSAVPNSVLISYIHPVSSSLSRFSTT